MCRLSQGRRRRPIPEGWVSPDEVSALETESSTSLPVSETTSLDVEGGYAAVGGLKGEAAIYSVDADKLERQVPIDEPITDTLWTGSKVIFATSQGTVKVYEGGSESAQVSEHAGPVTALSVHPGGKILASVGSDKSILLYDLETLQRVSRAHVDSGKHNRHHVLLEELPADNYPSLDHLRIPPGWPPIGHWYRRWKDQAFHDQDARAGCRV